MKKPKQVCQFCEKSFKGVKGHYEHCKVRNRAPEQPAPTYQDVVNAKLEGAKMNADSQVFRGRDAIIALTESVSKLNLAFAQVIGEWRF